MSIKLSPKVSITVKVVEALRVPIATLKKRQSV
jgi:hypothetical protein